MIFPDEEKDDAGYLALKFMHPRWLVKRWLGPHGKENVEKLLAFNNASAPVCLRVNILVTSREKFWQTLKKLKSRLTHQAGVKTELLSTRCLLS